MTFVKPSKIYRAPSDLEREALEDLRDRLKTWEGSALTPRHCRRWFLLVGVSGSILCGTGSPHSTRSFWAQVRVHVLGDSLRFTAFEETITLIDAALDGDLT